MFVKHFRLAACVSLAIATPCAVAQSKLYVSASAGSTLTSGNYNDQLRNAGAPQPGFKFISAGKDGNSDFGGRLAVGYRVTEAFAVELGYSNFGKQDIAYKFEKTTGLIPPNPFVTAQGRFRLEGITLDAVGTLPINAAFSANARIGLIATNLRYKEFQSFLGRTPEEFSKDSSQTRLHLGVGATYQINKALGATLDYTHAQGVGKSFAWNEDGNGRLNYGLLAAGIRYSF